MKRTFIYVWMFLLATTSCRGPVTESEEVSRTLGIGRYPGSPSENFAPHMVPDTTYRNLALYRLATHSSCEGYAQTAQLVTDGIVTEDYPKTFVVSTKDTVFARREQEYLFDENPHTANTAYGEDTYVQLWLQHWDAMPDELSMTGMIAYDPAQATDGYEVSVTGSTDGENWQTLFLEKGKQIEQKRPTRRISRGCGLEDDAQGLTLTDFTRTFKLDASQSYAFFRLNLKMKGAGFWRFSNLDFRRGGELIQMRDERLFTSAWTSKGAGAEWVCVDLGSLSTFDRISLHWVNKAVQGIVQTSSDGRSWKNLANLPGGEAKVDELAVNAKGRYVRISMDKSADGQPYVLSELKVMGRGGLVAIAHAQPAAEDNRIVLSGGNWKVVRASEVEASGQEVSLSSFDDASWLPATVPGTVLTSFVNAGAVPNPNYADNISYISESYFHSNFWYRNTFELPASMRGRHLFLHFDGINWKANVWLNGESVGRIEGAFTRAAFDVSELIREGHNVLAVEVICNAHFGGVKEKNSVSTDYNGGILGADNPTFHATIGWDWITSTRGRNVGIWNDVFLTAKGDVVLEDPALLVRLNLPDTLATLTPEVVVRNVTDKAVSGVVKGYVGEIGFERPVALLAGEEKIVRFSPSEYEQLRERQMRLWWPRGYGSSHLYDAGFSFEQHGATVDEVTYKAGIRQMTYDESNGILKLYVNGRRFIGRGGNWGFSENNLNYRAREYDAAVAYHADMNFTMIRNWVGMIGDNEFYEACDRHGIMVWQDFWLANPADGPEPDDEKMFLENAVDMVKRIRNHPSIALYCGRNEGYPPKTLDDGLRRIIDEWHADIHYISSSADNIVSGHGPYRALEPREYFLLKNGNDRFHSERGMPCVLSYEGLLRTLSPDALWPQNDQWGKHDFTMAGAQSGSSFNQLVQDAFGFPDNLSDFARYAQWVNYEGYRAMFESRSIQRKGLLLWMSHPCWPSMVWQTYDYYLEPTAAYFGCKHANEPLHIQLNPVENLVEVVNYSAGSHPSLTVCALILNLNGEVVLDAEAEIQSEEDTTVKSISLDAAKDKLTEVYFVKLYLKEGEEVLSENFYIKGVKPTCLQALNGMKRARLKQDFKYTLQNGQYSGCLTLKNTSDVPALFVRINLKGDDGEQILPVMYEDNYLSLLPNEQKQIAIEWKQEDSRRTKPIVEVTPLLK
ncbi:MAG: discoidin domain-containing protein [Bacteroidales bacterium]|nr:discoidin domain-containing protein [Bacteroidales bacterium]